MMTVFETALSPECTIYHIYVQPHAHDFGLVYTTHHTFTNGLKPVL